MSEHRMNWNLVVKIGFGLVIIAAVLLYRLKTYRLKELKKEIKDKGGELTEEFREKMERNSAQEFKYYMILFIITAILFILYHFTIPE